MNGANRGHFSDLLTPGFRQIFDDRFSEVPMILNEVFHVQDSTKADEKDSSVTGFGYAQETGEGQPIDYDDVYQGYKKTYTHIKYSKGFKITLEMVEDDQYNIMRKKPAALGKAMRRTAENQASLVFNRAFNSNYAEGPDGKVLISTAHPRPDGGQTQSNASSTGIELNEQNLEIARLATRAQLDDRGMKTDVEADTIVVPDALDKEAHLIVDSPLRQGTADNDMNPYRNKYKVITWKYLDDPKAWFLMDSTNHELNWFWRRRPQFKNDELFDTEYAVYKSTMRLSRGWSDWRGIWGSKGDNQAYSN